MALCNDGRESRLMMLSATFGPTPETCSIIEPEKIAIFRGGETVKGLSVLAIYDHGV
jgi:hypothetical protein